MPRNPSAPWSRAARRILPLALLATFALAMVLRPSLAPAGVEEQRRRLPPPARECPDAIEGVWLGHEQLNGRWYRFSLFIERTEPGAPDLTGHIESYSWDGGPADSSPPPCEGGNSHREFVVDMPALGRFEENRVSFVGQSWTLNRNICGQMSGSYYPDGFEGDLIHEGTEFNSLSDDGHNPVVPVVFRRIKCGEDRRVTPDLPPPKPPAAYNTGCGGCF